MSKAFRGKFVTAFLTAFLVIATLLLLLRVEPLRVIFCFWLLWMSVFLPLLVVIMRLVGC